MKILIIGGNGTIGKKVTERFAKNQEVIIAGRTSGDVKVARWPPIAKANA